MSLLFDWEDRLFELGVRTVSPTYPDQRLQSAIKNHLGYLAHGYHIGKIPRDNIPNWLAATVDKIKRQYPSCCDNIVVKTWIDVHRMLINGDRYSFKERKVDILKQVLKESIEVTDIFREYLSIDSLSVDIHNIWQSVADAYLNRMYCSILQQTMLRNSRSRNNTLIVRETTQAIFLLSRELCLVQSRISHESYYLDYDSILMLYDLWTQRYLLFLSAFLLQSALPSVYTPGELYWKGILQWGDELLERYGNRAFKYLKLFEAICVGEILVRDDEHHLSDDFVQSTRINFIADDKVFLEQHLDKLLTLLRSTSVEMISETFGLYRLWGHPVVDERAGCVKVKQIGKKSSTPSYYVLKMINACITREFCLNYIAKEGKWPRVLITNQENPLYRAHEMQKLRWHGMYSRDQLELWNDVILRKNFEFNTCVDYSQLIDDKAISCYKQHWDYVYDRDVLGYRPPKPTESRRVVMEILRREDLDVNDILRKIQSRRVPDDWKVIGLHSKEREIKIEPRMFIMMVLEMRLYFCVTEMNLADQVFKYFPQQTMTSDETSLTNRLISLTTRSRSHDSPHISVVINIDFEKWNLQWRIKSTEYVFSLLDSLFGRPNLYTYSHEFFKESMFYLVSRLNPPDNVSFANRNNPPESDMLWYNDESGKEGIRQKGWTLITIGALLYVESITGITGIITGQGDNQVIVASFPLDKSASSDLTLKERVSDYMGTLIQTFERIGLPIKAEESWCSTSLFAYGKDLIHKAAYLPMVLKKLARVMPDTNDLLPTLTNSLSTIFSAGYAACCKGYEVSIPYCVAYSECYLYLLSHCKYSLISNGRGFNNKISQLIKLNPQFVKFLLTIPHSLAGYATMSMLDYMTRGHSDPVTAGLIAIHALAKGDSLYSRFLYYLIHEPRFSVSQDFAFLIMDPTCINWKKPAPCTRVIKRYIEEQMGILCHNKDFQCLFHKDVVTEDRNLILNLMKIRPVAPRVLNEIYRHSPSGARSGILATVSNVRTIKAIAQRSNEHSVFAKVKEYEDSFSEHMFELFSNIQRLPRIEQSICTTQLADKLRVDSWFPNQDVDKIEGVTMPHPLEQFVLNKYSVADDLQPGIFYILDSNDFHTLMTTAGSIRPYIGNLTRERKVSRLLNLPVKDPPLKSALRLQTLSDYITGPTDNLYRFLDKIITTRTSIPLGLLRFASDRILTGSRTHRLQDVSTKHGGLINVRPNPHSHIYISSDKVGKVDYTNDNLNINFQVAILTHLYLLPYRCKHDPLTRTFIATFKCNSCTQNIDEPIMTMPDPDDLTYKDYSSCKLLFSDGVLNPVHVLTSQNGSVMSVESMSLPQSELVWAVAYQLALQLIIMSAKTRSKSSQEVFGLSKAGPNILGIGEISKIGFIRLVLSIAHLHLLYYLMSYYNLRIPRSGITIDVLIDLSIDGSTLSLYEPLCSAYPIAKIRDQVRSQVNIVEPFDYSENASSNLSIIKQIIRSRLVQHIHSLCTLPPLQCYTPQEWSIVVCLNLIHRLVRQEISLNPGLNILTGAYCLHYRRVIHELDHIADGDELTHKLLDIECELSSLPHYITEDFPNRIITLDCLIERPIFRAPESVEYTLRLLGDGDRGRLESENQGPSTKGTTHCPISFAQRQVYGPVAYPCHGSLAIINEINLPLHCPTLHTDITLPYVRNKERYSKHNAFFTPDGSTAAHYKYYSIISHLRISPTRCAALADGAGTVTRMLVKTFNARVFFNSLLPLSSYIQHRYIHYIPVEFDDEVVNNLIRYDLTLFNQNDLSSPQTIASITRELQAEEPFDLITCDLESRDYNVRLVHMVSLNVCRFAQSMLGDIGHLIFKIYLSSLDCAYRIVQNCRVCFRNCKIITSKYSSNESSEVFLVCNEVIRQIAIDPMSVDLRRDGVDAQIVINILSNALCERLSHNNPYWVYSLSDWRKITNSLRALGARDISSRALIILTGSEPSLDDNIGDWLAHRMNSLQMNISMILEGINEEMIEGFRISSITNLTTSHDDLSTNLKKNILYSIHCQMIRSILPMIHLGATPQTIFETVERYVIGNHKLYDSSNRLIMIYNIRRENINWTRQYGRHLFRYLGSHSLRNR